MNIKPAPDRVVIKPVEATAITASGIFIPDTAREKSDRGEVIAKGDATKFVAVGDKVIYQRGAGVEEQGVLIMEEKYIYAIV